MILFNFLFSYGGVMKILVFLLMLFIINCSYNENSKIVLLSSPADKVYSYSGNYQIAVKTYPEQELDSIFVYYKLNSENSFVKTKMKKENNSYIGLIPAVAYGNTIFYYVKGYTVSNEELRYPESETAYLHFSVVRPEIVYCETDFDCFSGEICDTFRCLPVNSLCQNSLDCPQGQICNLFGDQKCYTHSMSCVDNENCQNYEYCFEGFCIPKGKSCETNGDCNLGQECVSNFCTATQQCTNNESCNEEMECNLNLNICILKKECETNSDCLNSLICNATINRCVKHNCSVHLDCNTGEICDSVTKTCVKSDEIECYTDEECLGEKPYCDLTDLKCKECIYTPQCGEDKICYDNVCIQL